MFTILSLLQKEKYKQNYKLMLVFLSQNHIIHQVNVFISVGTSRSATAMMSVHCARVSELLHQLVNDTCQSFVWKLCPQLSNIISLQLI